MFNPTLIGSCIGKVKYPTLSKAEKAVRKMAAKGKVGLHPYWCSFCNRYHVGHESYVKRAFKTKGGK